MTEERRQMSAMGGIEFDVIVIGGGPAGAVVASLLALANRRVLVIERDIHPRDHVGESLTPSTNPIVSVSKMRFARATVERVATLPLWAARLAAEGWRRVPEVESLAWARRARAWNRSPGIGSYSWTARCAGGGVGEARFSALRRVS